MIPPQIAHAPARPVPASGKGLLVFGDSISDITIPYGQYYSPNGQGVTDIATRYGWRVLNTTTIPNGSAETNVADWQAETNCTIAQDNTVAAVAGTHSAMLTATAAGAVIVNIGGTQPALGTATIAAGAVTAIAVAFGSADYQGAPTVFIVGGGGTGATAHAVINAAGVVTSFVVDTGGTGYTSAPTVFCSGMRPTSAQAATPTAGVLAGQQYTLSTYVFANAGSAIATGGIFLQAVFKDTAGALTTASGAATTATGAWTRISLTFTVPTACVACWFRVVATATLAGQVLRMDAAMLQPGPNLNVYSDFTTRAAIGGTTLSNIATPTNSGQNTFAARVGAGFAPDVVLLAYGMNDLAQSTTANGATATTVAAFQSAFNSVATALLALSPVPVVIVMGIPNFTTAAWNVAAPTGGYYAFANQLEEVLRAGALAHNWIYVPVRPYEDIGFVQVGNVHPIVPQGQQILARRVIDVLEHGL